MLIQLFSNYLLEHDLINLAQFVSILEVKKSMKLPIGNLALAEGFMTSTQVDVSHKTQTRANQKFGDIAIDQGFLTDNQLQILLDIQAKDDVLLSQILVDHLAILSHEAFSKYLQAFKDFYNLSERNYADMIANDAKTVIAKIAVIEPNDLFFTCASCVLNLIVRLIDRDAVVLKSIDMREELFANIAYHSCVGDQNVVVGIASKSNELLQLASKFSSVTYSDFDEECQDSVKEFLNCCTGLFVSTLEKEKNLDLNLEIPVFGFEKTVSKVRVLPIKTYFGVIFVTYQNR